MTYREIPRSELEGRWSEGGQKDQSADYGISAGVHPGHLSVDVPRSLQSAMADHIEAWFRGNGIDFYRRVR